MKCCNAICTTTLEQKCVLGVCQQNPLLGLSNTITGIKTRALVSVEAVSMTSEIEARKQSSEEQIWQISERIDFLGFDI